MALVSRIIATVSVPDEADVRWCGLTGDPRSFQFVVASELGQISLEFAQSFSRAANLRTIRSWAEHVRSGVGGR
jgi:hypothetical protein